MTTPDKWIAKAWFVIDLMAACQCTCEIGGDCPRCKEPLSAKQWPHKECVVCYSQELLAEFPLHEEPMP